MYRLVHIFSGIAMSDIVIVSVFGWQRTRNIYRGMRSTGGRCLSQTIPCMRTTTSSETPSSCVGSVIRQLRGLLYSVIVTLSARPVMLYEIMIVWEQLFLVLYIAFTSKKLSNCLAGLFFARRSMSSWRHLATVHAYLDEPAFPVSKNLTYKHPQYYSVHPYSLFVATVNE